MKQQQRYDEIVSHLTTILMHYALSSGEQEEIIDSFRSDKTAAFRVNTLKDSVKSVLDLIVDNGLKVSPVPWSEVSFIVDNKSQLARLPAAKDSPFYIQNLSSQLTVIILAPQEGDFILDLAAAPGGKTGFIAQLINNNGRISAVEPVKDRYFRLIHNLRSLGVTIAKCYQKDGRIVGKLCHEWFDRVLLDAPCSSMAQIDLREPESFAHWSIKKVKECSRKQKQLIVSAFDSLKPGGEMVYSTCSWMVEENEEVVQHLLMTYPKQVEIMTLKMPIINYLPGLTLYSATSYHEDIAKTCRVIPNSLFEAFYIAKLRKLVY